MRVSVSRSVPSLGDTPTSGVFGSFVTFVAAKRITRLVVEDKITEDLREAWFEKFPPETTKLGYLVSCKKCTSFWAAAISVAVATTPLRPLLTALALSEIVILADRAEDRYLAEKTDMMGFN